jgi:beta-glucanase (GH16 family)
MGAGAAVELSGAANSTTTADASGNFSFSGLGDGSYTITPSKPGFGFNPASQSETINGADVSGIGFVTTAQPQTFNISGTISPTAGGAGATLVLSGTASENISTNNTGAYSFSDLVNGSYAVTPSNAGYSFSPTSQAVTISGANVTGVNFTANPQTATYSISGTISPATVGSGSLVTLSGTANATTTADASGNYSFTGLANGSYTVTPSSKTATFSPTSQGVTINSANVMGVNFTATASSNVIFFDDFTGTTLSPAWTIIQRHGEYAQSESECNTAQQVSVANSVLTITTAVGPATCGDFNTDGSVRHAPQSWPYVSGDVQWTNFNFTYGTLEVRAQFPPQSTGVWPAIWMLGQNCQVTNIYTADTGYSTCPNPGTSGYQEIDTVECDPGGSWCHFISYNGSVSPETLICNFPVDTNWHVYTMVWTSESLSLSMDGQALPGCSVTGNAVPSNPMFLIMQTQTSDYSVFGPPNNALLPTTFNIDYVKVTQP